MHQSCKQCGIAFDITPDDLAFYDKVSPVFNGKKEPIPPPTLCPDCRQQRRLAQSNEFHLYQRTCDLCGERKISQYTPDYPGKVYCRNCWESDRWDPLSYGRDFDFSRPFFDQFRELCQSVPAKGINQDGELINSDYIHYAGTSKNSYLIMHADFCEDCYYGYGIKSCRSCVDGFYNLHSELCYDCIDCHRCYGLIGSQNCINCHSSYFLEDCIGCKNCLLCVGLREREYCIENEQVSREEYERRIRELQTGSHSVYQSLREQRQALSVRVPHKAVQGHNMQNCSGDHLVNCKDVYQSFDCEEVENARYSTQMVLGAKDVMDVWQYGNTCELAYECSCFGEKSYYSLFCFMTWGQCSEMLYCMTSEATRQCFGCTQTKRNQFCILNKQYTKEEYNALVPKIIEHMRHTGEWGEFFPMHTSQFGYNHTTAQIYYPLSQEQALQRGIPWSTYVPPKPEALRSIPADQLPDTIEDTPDDILHWAILCEATGKPFKITQQELRFYREQRLPIPRRQWFQRHLDRFALRNPRKLWKRECMKCGKEIETSYSPDRPEIVYCEECYLKEVY